MIRIAKILAAILVACGTTHPDADDQRHIDYGRKFPCVARIVCKSSDGVTSHDGSCVLIADRVALTAAHVVDGMDQWAIVTDDGKKHEVVSVSMHDDYVHGKFGKGDIAVCVSGDSFGLSWYPEIYSGRDEAGKVASIAGFGAIGDFSRGRVSPGDGVRRAGSNVIDCVGEGYVTCSVGSGVSTDLEFLIAPGDSGGGLFIGNKLAGINSHVSSVGKSAPRGVYGDESGHTRISDYVDWIKKEMNCDGQDAVRDVADRGRGLEEEEAEQP